MTVLSRWRFTSIAMGLLLSVFYATEARAQDPAPPADSSSSFLNAPPAAPVVASAPADNSPVVRAAPGNWGMSFAFGGLGNLSVGGINDQKAGNLLFTEIGFRAVLPSVTIPFSVGLGMSNNTTRTDPSVSSTDVGLSFSGGVLKPFRVWRRIQPYFGGLFHFDVLKPSGNDNWLVHMALGPLVGIEYFVADRVSFFGQGMFEFGVGINSQVANIVLATAMSGGGQLGLNFYF